MKTISLAIVFASLGGVASAGLPAGTMPADFSNHVSASGDTCSAPWSWEIAAVYNHALTDIDKGHNTPSIDTYGVDVSGIYAVRKKHKFTFRLGYTTGAQAGYNVTNLAFMPGYRYENPISDKLVVFAGAGVGLGLSMLDTPALGRRHYGVSDKDDMLNVVYSVEVGARYAILENLDIVGAVMFNGGTSPFHSASYEHATEEQMNIGVRLGIGGQF